MRWENSHSEGQSTKTNTFVLFIMDSVTQKFQLATHNLLFHKKHASCKPHQFQSHRASYYSL